MPTKVRALARYFSPMQSTYSGPMRLLRSRADGCCGDGCFPAGRRKMPGVRNCTGWHEIARKTAESNASYGRPAKKQRRRRADLAEMREEGLDPKDPSAAKSERFPALALSRSGSKGISHPRHTDNPVTDCDVQRRTPALAAATIHLAVACWQPSVTLTRASALLTA
jgi:hypothetical protein